MEDLGELVKSGRARAIGCSNYAAWRLAKSNLHAEELSLPRFATIQREYNFLTRGAESELIDACRHYGVTLIPYFPLASGLLWRGTLLGKERFRASAISLPAQVKRAEAMLDRLQSFAKDSDHSLGELRSPG